MSTVALTFDGLNLSTGAYSTDAGAAIDWGTEAVASALLTGWYQPESFDQIAREQNLTRIVVVPLLIKTTTSDLLIAAVQALTGSLAGASVLNPKTLTAVLAGSSRTSTFRVWGGAWKADHDDIADRAYILHGTLTLLCDWPVYGPVQNLGSSGSPLITNAHSPANVTLTLSPTGDVPADVTLFVKNRSASAIRSLLVGCVSGDTTWACRVDQAVWTLDADGGRSGSVVTALSGSPLGLQKIAHFTAPTLPTDTRFRVYLRMGQRQTTFTYRCRVRLVSGSSEIVGEWRALPVQFNSANSTGFETALLDMGAFMFPVGEVGQLGGGSTTIYLETIEGDTGISFGDHLEFSDALFFPDDSTLLAETMDTTLTLAAASGVTRVETDQVYTSGGDPAGGVVIGAHIRSLGGRYALYTSQGYAKTLDLSLPYVPENVDVWASVTPRYLHLVG